ncbi:10521_t:CDS:2, partial [Gigaspora rosea]
SDIQIQFHYPFIVKSDKVIGFIYETVDKNIGKNLIIKELIQDKENCITFLRKSLGGFNSIYMSSIKEKVIEFLETEGPKCDNIMMKYFEEASKYSAAMIIKIIKKTEILNT